MKIKVIKYIVAVVLVVTGVFVTSSVDAKASVDRIAYDYVEINGVLYHGNNDRHYTSYEIIFDFQGGYGFDPSNCRDYYDETHGKIRFLTDINGVIDQTYTGNRLSLNECLTNTACERPGYTFDGFYTEQYGQGEKITASTVFTSDCTVYANWILTDLPSALKVKTYHKRRDYYQLYWGYQANVDYYIVKIKSGSIKKTFKMTGDEEGIIFYNYSKKSKKKVTVKVTPVNSLGKGPTYKKTFKVKKTTKN